jgi:anti-sigma factor RsiW
MTCADAEELLLDSFDGRLTAAARRALAAHLAGCHACAAFATRMHALDAQLVAALPAPAVPPSLAAGVRSRIRRERVSTVNEGLPDLIHLAGCGAATLLSAALLPLDATVTLAAGIAMTCASYVCLAVVRWSIVSVGQPDW